MSRLFAPLTFRDPKESQLTRVYTVQEGETLRSIAERFNMKESDLRDINNLKKRVSNFTGHLLRVFRKKKRSKSLSSLPQSSSGEIGDLAQPEDSPQKLQAAVKNSKREQPEDNNQEQESEQGRSNAASRRKVRSQSVRLPTHREEKPVLPKLIGGSTSEVLSHPKYSSTLVPQLQACLPSSRRYYDWKLLYSLAQHGCSLPTLLRKVGKQSPTLIVVETTKGDVFGGFTSEAWQKSPNYYGIGESFVFSCKPKFEHFPWTCMNTMIMFSNDESIAMGGGGDFAWFLNSDLSRGSSGPSTTFMNRRLTSEPDFDIYCVEVWGFAVKT